MKTQYLTNNSVSNILGLAKNSSLLPIGMALAMVFAASPAMAEDDGSTTTNVCSACSCCCSSCGDSTADKDTEPGPVIENPDSPAAKIATSLAGTGSKLAMYRSQLDDLRKRLGEIRYGAQDGIWARGIAERDRIDGTSGGSDFKQKWYGANIGVDHIVMKNENEMWIGGANFKYNKADQKEKSASGKGHLHSYGANIYATWANYDGYYADIVITGDRYAHKLGITDAKGKYDAWGMGASIEVGKMFSSTQKDEGWGPWYDQWWVEPQAELSYYWIQGKNFNLGKTGVKQKDGQSLVGRLGVVAGKQWKYGGNREVADKRYLQAYVKGGVKHEFVGKQGVTVEDVLFDKALRGTTVYYGVGVDWNVAKQVKAYAQVERESGSKYKKDYTASVGLKWEF